MDSSDNYSANTCETMTDTNTYYDSTRCDTSSRGNHSDYTDSSESRRHKRRDSDCSYDCGIKNAKTPVGVWNLVYSCDDACTTTGTMAWINQLLLNGDKTLNSFTAPDLTNDPFPYLLTPGSGVWEIINERKYKLHITHIGYRSSDGCPQVYYKVRIVCKLNHKGTKLRFCGEAQSYDLCDPTMCTITDEASIYFSGHGAKVLEPSY